MNTSINALDGMDSLLWSGDSQAVQRDTYSPYGGAPARSESSLLPGFNGERPDPINQTYHLGNGYRTYNPVLMRFTAPDSWSPFGAGGLNAYAYCEGDPINRTDPSGHMSWQAGVGIGLGVLSILGAIATMGMSIAAEGGVLAAIASADAADLVAGGLGLAADVTGIASIATQNSDPEASRILGWISFGLGIASVGVHAGNRVHGKLKPSRSFDLLGGTVGDAGKADGAQFGIMAMGGENLNYTPLTMNVTAFEDRYKGGRRLNIVGHGRLGCEASYMWAGRLSMTAPDLVDRLNDAGIAVDDFDSIRLLTCFSADGKYSLGAEMHRLTHKPVKAYHGFVYLTYPVNKVFDGVMYNPDGWRDIFVERTTDFVWKRKPSFGLTQRLMPEVTYDWYKSAPFTYEPAYFGPRLGG